MAKFEHFIEKYYEPITTQEKYTTKLLDVKDPGFDCYICVSDVIWKYYPKHGLDKGFLLASKTMRGKRKIAYAASRGPSVYPPKIEEQFQRYIRDFDHIAVREKSLQRYIEDTTGLEATHVVDPVFLQDWRFYNELAVRPQRGKPFVLIYIVMERNTTIVTQAVEFAQQNGLDVVELGEDPDHARIPQGTYHDFVYGVGVEEWLGYLLEADYVFTNSFHGCCLSMILSKQFFAGQRHGDKIDSLLDMFNLEWRRIGPEVSGSELRMADIDYSQVHPLVAEQVAHSKADILTAIQRVRKDVARSKRIEKLKKTVHTMPGWVRKAARLLRRAIRFVRRRRPH